MFYLNCIQRNSEALKFTLKFNKKGHWQWRFGSSFWHLAVFDLIVSADQTNKKKKKTETKENKQNKQQENKMQTTKQNKNIEQTAKQNNKAKQD